jgi:GNAT superfamily N-acetyltransferase
MDIVAPAADSELEAIAAFVNQVYRGPEARGGWASEADYIAGQRTDAGKLREGLRKPGAVILTLRDEAEGDEASGPLLGCVWLEPAHMDAWHLGMLSVRLDLQKAGVGRRLLAAAEDYARSRGAVWMEMTVIGIRDTLIAWYERRGYRRTGETRPFPYGDERFGVPLRDDLAFVVLEKKL